MEVRQEALGTRLDHLALVVGQRRFGLGEKIEDRQFLLSQPLGDAALLLSSERLRQLDKPTEVLVDVEAAGVVVGDQLLNTLDEVEPGGVPRRGTDGPLLEQRRQSIRLGALRPANRAASTSKSIWDRSINGSGSLPSAAARITYSSAPTARSSSWSTASATSSSFRRLMPR